MKIIKKEDISNSRRIVWAKNTGKLLYSGSPVCHDFGNSHFYYASCVVNCMFDCQYCFLKGKYDNDDIIVYDNLEDYFNEAEHLLSQLNADEQVYLCVSFDTDLFPLESKIHYVKKWSEFAAKHNNLKVEIRTKASQTSPEFWQEIVNKNMIYAFSLSPQQIIDRFEHKTASLSARLSSIAAAINAGANIRLCIDPIIYVGEWEKYYCQFIDEVFSKIDSTKIQDVALGTFRISHSYLRKMRQKYPDNPLVWFPYELEEGFYQYPAAIQNLLEIKEKSALSRHIKEDIIFTWHELDEDAITTYPNSILPDKYFDKSRYNNNNFNIINTDKLVKMLRCSHTQLMQLDQLYNFANASGIDIEPIWNYIKDTYSIPPNSKSETSAILKSIKSYLISEF